MTSARQNHSDDHRDQSVMTTEGLIGRTRAKQWLFHTSTCRSRSNSLRISHVLDLLFAVVVVVLLTRTVEGTPAFVVVRLSGRQPAKALRGRGSSLHANLLTPGFSDGDGLDEGIGVGIDLGTTNSAIAYLKDGIPTIVSIPNNGRTVPSVVTFLDGGEVLVGRPAWEREIAACGAYRNVKRIIGTGGKLSPDIAAVVPFLQASSTGKTFKKNSLLNQIHDGMENPTLLKNASATDDFIRPEVISAHILQTLKRAAEAHTGQTISRAVIGVPAYFHDVQRDATKKAAEMAGIRKVKLLREPEAAALAYGIGKEQIGLGEDDELVLVFDLGGGTFDVSILVVGGGVTEIISTSGNAQLGGSVFDAKIAAHCFKLLREKRDVSAKNWSQEAKNAVMLAAESIRIYLSNSRVATLALPISEEEWRRMAEPSAVILPADYTNSVGDDLEDKSVLSNSTHIILQFARKDMERLCEGEFQALLRPLREVAIMSGALLRGDSSPSIVAAALELEEEEQAARAVPLEFEDFYGGDAMAGATSIDVESDLLVAFQVSEMKEAKKSQQRGRKRARDVAKEERVYRQEKKKLEGTISKRPSSENVKVRDGISGRPISRIILVGGATRMPGIGRLLAALTGVVPQRTVNPDEAVALGCAVHAGVLDGTEGMGTVLSPMQAAILRAVAMEQGRVDDNNDEDEFDAGEPL